MATKDIIFTLGVMLVAGLVCQLVADALRVAADARAPCSAGRCSARRSPTVIDVPLDSTGAELLLTLGVSFILFHGGLQLSARSSAASPSDWRCSPFPGVVVTALVAGLGRGARLRRAILDGAPHRRGARADRPGDPHPALRPHRDPPEDRADGDRGVRAERRDRRRARARPRRRRARAATARSAEPVARLPRGPRHLDRRSESSSESCSRSSSPTVAQASGGSRPRSRSSPSSRSGTSRSTRPAAAATSGAFLAGLIVGQHGPPPARDALRATSATCGRSSRRSPRSS